MELNAKSYDAQRNLGYVLEKKGNYGGAVVRYQKAIELAPNLSYLHLGLGKNYRALGKYTEAVAAFQRATEVDPKNAEAFDWLGRGHFDQRNYELALQSFEKALELQPRYALAQGHIGWVYYFAPAKDYAKAAEAFKKALEMGGLDQARTAEFQAELGLSLAYQGKCKDARAALKKAQELLVAVSAPDLVEAVAKGFKLCEGKWPPRAAAWAGGKASLSPAPRRWAGGPALGAEPEAFPVALAWGSGLTWIAPVAFSPGL